MSKNTSVQKTQYSIRFDRFTAWEMGELLTGQGLSTEDLLELVIAIDAYSGSFELTKAIRKWVKREYRAGVEEGEIIPKH
jgi:hypothetical protein